MLENYLLLVWALTNATFFGGGLSGKKGPGRIELFCCKAFNQLQRALLS